MQNETKARAKNLKSKKETCRHDYRNAIQIGKIDYQCPLCGKILNPMEWFLMNSFEFIDVEVEKNSKDEKV